MLPYVTVKGVILAKHSRVSPALLRIPHVLILVDFSCKIPICQCGSSHHHFHQSHEIPQSYQDLYLHFAIYLHWTSTVDQPGMLKLMGRQFGTDSISEYIFRSEYFYVMVFFFFSSLKPWRTRIKDFYFIWGLGADKLLLTDSA